MAPNPGCPICHFCCSACHFLVKNSRHLFLDTFARDTFAGQPLGPFPCTHMEGGARRTWKGFSAFPIIGVKEEGLVCHSPVKLVVGDGGVLPCCRYVPRCPANLHTAYWGAYGYSSWCRSELMALVEAKSSHSRGVRTIKAGPLGGPTACRPLADA